MNLKNYSQYNAWDFLEDADFRSWVSGPTAESDQYWQQVLDAHPNQKENTEKAITLFKEMEAFFKPEELRSATINDQFVERLKQEAALTKHGRQRAVGRRVFLQRIAAAASVLILISLSLWFWVVQPNYGMQMVATGYGEWKTLTLPDGSKIQLNASSQVRYPRNWEVGKDREVWLEGEAFFEVEKDKEGAKFTVFTNDLAIEVLGTAFNVHNRGQETEVFLEEGAVRLDWEEEQQKMVPGELVVFSSEKKEITEYREAPAELHTSWKDGALIIKDEPVAAIFDKIEVIFGYPVVTQDKELLKAVKTIAIPMDDIEVAIPILERVLAIEIQIENDQLIVK